MLDHKTNMLTDLFAIIDLEMQHKNHMSIHCI